MGSSYYRQSLEDYLSGLDIKAEHVLDVGGASNPVQKRVHAWDVADYKFLDNNIETPSVMNFYHWDMNEPFAWTDHSMEFVPNFDIVFCLEVMEYIFDPMVAMKNLRLFLKPGGILYITFNSVYPPHNPYEFDMLRYTKFGALRLLHRNGFEVLDLVPRIMHSQNEYLQFLNAERYRYKGGREAGTLFDAGYIIKAKTI